jgi:hypothetical protein
MLILKGDIQTFSLLPDKAFNSRKQILPVDFIVSLGSVT